MFASSSTDKTIRIWDMRVCNAVKILGQLSKSASNHIFLSRNIWVKLLKFYPISFYLLLLINFCINKINDMKLCDNFSVSGAFSVNSGGRILIRGDCEGNLSAFDISTTKMIFSGKIFNSQVNCLRITNESRYVVASDRTW